MSSPFRLHQRRILVLPAGPRTALHTAAAAPPRGPSLGPAHPGLSYPVRWLLWRSPISLEWTVDWRSRLLSIQSLKLYKQKPFRLTFPTESKYRHHRTAYEIVLIRNTNVARLSNYQNARIVVFRRTDVYGCRLIDSLVHQKRSKRVPGWKEGGMRSVVVEAITSVTARGRTTDNRSDFQMRANILSFNR